MHVLHGIFAELSPPKTRNLTSILLNSDHVILQGSGGAFSSLHGVPFRVAAARRRIRGLHDGVFISPNVSLLIVRAESKGTKFRLAEGAHGIRWKVKEVNVVATFVRYILLYNFLFVKTINFLIKRKKYVHI